MQQTRIGNGGAATLFVALQVLRGVCDCGGFSGESV
jgi:hypothetical protein